MTAEQVQIYIGEELNQLLSDSVAFSSRDLLSSLEDYLYSPVNDRVCILYGLLCTGKTTLMLQAIARMRPKERQQTAYIKANQDITMSDLFDAIHELEASGYRYVFIDDVTVLDDFIESSAILADIYASSGMKIILAGDESLSFYLASKDQLYDRSHLVHTTFIPYREYARLYDSKGIDEYLEHGGVLKQRASNNLKDRKTYYQDAVARNIEWSNEHCVEKNELTEQEMLEAIDFEISIDTESMEYSNGTARRTIAIQPFMRWANMTKNKDTILEDAVLVETQRSSRYDRILWFVTAGTRGLMIGCNRTDLTCTLYAISDCNAVKMDQIYDLMDVDICNEIAKQYGVITEKFVIYRGKSTEVDEVIYLNVEVYLKSLYEFSSKLA